MNCWISEQFSRVRKSSRVRVHQHASSFTYIYIYNITYYRQVVAEQELQSTECLGRKDRILAELIQLTCSCREEQLAVVESCRHTTIDSTSNTFDRHEEFVASDSISWRQGKFSWLVLLDCSASNQQTTLKRTQEN